MMPLSVVRGATMTGRRRWKDVGCTSVRQDEGRSGRHLHNMVQQAVSMSGCSVSISQFLYIRCPLGGKCLTSMHSLPVSRLMNRNPTNRPLQSPQHLPAPPHRWISRWGSLGRRGHMCFVPNKRLQSPGLHTNCCACVPRHDFCSHPRTLASSHPRIHASASRHLPSFDQQ